MTGDRSLVDEAEGVGISGVKFSYLAGVVRFGYIQLRAMHAFLQRSTRNLCSIFVVVAISPAGGWGWGDKTQQENVARRLTPKKKFRLPK